MSQYLFFLLILACPLMMVFMMRGMHGGRGGSAQGGHGHGGMHGQGEPDSSLEDLRRQRDELDRQIEERQSGEQMPVGSGWR